MHKILLLSIVIFLISCDEQIESKVELPEDTDQEITYQQVYNNILAPNCASCHGEVFPSGNWVLPQTEDELINVNSIKPGFEEEVYVIPGDPENSYLMKRLQGRPGIPVMPDGGKMDQDLIDQVAKWIDPEGTSR